MTIIAGIIALIAGCLLGWFSRYYVIEPEQIHAICNAAAPAWWCAGRALIIEITFRGTWGITAVGAAALAWVLRRGPAATFVTLALFAGGLGLYLYDTTWAASGVLAALLRLPRIGDDPPDPREFSA